MDIAPVTALTPTVTLATTQAAAAQASAQAGPEATPAFQVSLSSLPLDLVTPQAAATALPASPTTPAPAAPTAAATAAQEALTAPVALADPNAASLAAAATDLQAGDVLAQATQIVQAQRAVVAALNSGAADASTLMSGLPPGATAILLGGGWARMPTGTDPAEAETAWVFHFPFRREDVPAVSGSSRTAPAGDRGRGAPGAPPLRVYGPQGREEEAPLPPHGSTLDILD